MVTVGLNWSLLSGSHDLIVFVYVSLHRVMCPLGLYLIIILIVRLDSNLINRLFLSLLLTLQHPPLRALIILLTATLVRLLLHFLGVYPFNEPRLQAVPSWVIPVDGRLAVYLLPYQARVVVDVRGVCRDQGAAVGLAALPLHLS